MPKRGFRLLQIYLGSLYVYDLKLFGRTYQVKALPLPVSSRAAGFRDSRLGTHVGVMGADRKLVNGARASPARTRSSIHHVRQPIHGKPGSGVSSGEAIALWNDLPAKTSDEIGIRMERTTLRDPRGKHTIFTPACVCSSSHARALYESGRSPWPSC